MTQKIQGARRLLIVDDEEHIRTGLKKILEAEGYEVVAAESGVKGEELAFLERFDLILSDIHMPNSRMGGLELLQNVRAREPVPVILMTGFAAISSAKEAADLGANGFLPKPFKSKDLLSLVRTALGIQGTNLLPELQDQDEDYRKLSIEDFISGKQIKYDIYVRLSAAKYVKVAHEGEDISIERIKKYREKGIEFLYLKKDDFKKYLEFNLGISRMVQSSSTISKEKKLNFLKHSSEILLEHCFFKEVDEQELEYGKTIVESVATAVTQQDELFTLLEILGKHSNATYAHSLAVSMYAVLIAKHCGWQAPSLIYKVGMTGLFHDIGKKELPQELISKPRHSMSFEEIRLYEEHTTKGMEILSRVPGIPTDVIQVVYQHHETCTGTGFPMAITKGKIQPMARLIAVSDEFCKYVIESPGNPKIHPVEAIRKIQTLKSGVLDPEFIGGLSKCFKM